MVVGALGCSDKTLRDEVFETYPLEPGWQWSYGRTLDVELLGSNAAVITLVDSAQVVTRGEEALGDDVAFVLASTFFTIDGLTFGQQFFQQTANQLLQVPGPGEGNHTSVLPKPGVSPKPSGWNLLSQNQVGESSRVIFRYPLIRGNRWVAQESPELVLREVVGRERIHVPAGEFDTIRIRTEVFGAVDFVYEDWVGSEGLVRREASFVLEDFLYRGNPLPERIVEIVQLTSFRPPSS
ncbi:MAG: hypothetical protein HKN21_14435, partial [Candidatus Eisenbacteria bacterium]|nr:hypothetical protein [Candidatus Eisenbacteria bacterium]